MNLLNELIKTDAGKVAILGATVGGCFALFNQLVTKGVDAVSAFVSRRKTLDGLLMTALGELLSNLSVLAKLMGLIQTMDFKTEMPLLDAWLKTNRLALRDTQTEEFLRSDLVIEHYPYAATIMPMGQGSHLILALVEWILAEKPADLDRYIVLLKGHVVHTCKASAHLIIHLLHRNRKLRYSVLSTLTVERLSGMYDVGILLSINTVSKPMVLWLKEVCERTTKSYPSEAERCYKAAKALGL